MSFNKQIGLIGVKSTLGTTLEKAGLTRVYSNPALIFNLGLAPGEMRACVPPALRDRVLNANLTFDKFRQNEILADAGVSVPRSFTVFPNTCVVIKKPYHSYQGRGIEVVTKAASGRYYYQELITKRREFRAHAATWFDPVVFTIQEKKPKEHGRRGHVPDAEDRLCWNLENGWWYTRSTVPENHKLKCASVPLFKRVSDITVRALEALGYDYGAVDIIMDNARKLYILEVNSTPGIKGPSKDIYRQVFQVLVKDVKEGLVDVATEMQDLPQQV